MNTGLAIFATDPHGQDGAHGSNSSCVMGLGTAASAISQLTGTVPNRFVSNGSADMQAAGGK